VQLVQSTPFNGFVKKLICNHWISQVGNETNMCDLVFKCPLLKIVRLGSHGGASLTDLGSAGRNIFAETSSNEG
jgi:hypothetical protein